MMNNALKRGCAVRLQPRRPGAALAVWRPHYRPMSVSNRRASDYHLVARPITRDVNHSSRCLALQEFDARMVDCACPKSVCRGHSLDLSKLLHIREASTCVLTVIDLPAADVNLVSFLTASISLFISSFLPNTVSLSSCFFSGR